MSVLVIVLLYVVLCDSMHMQICTYAFMTNLKYKKIVFLKLVIGNCVQLAVLLFCGNLEILITCAQYC